MTPFLQHVLTNNSLESNNSHFKKQYTQRCRQGLEHLITTCKDYLVESVKYDKRELGEAKVGDKSLEAAEQLLDKEGVEEKMLNKLPKDHRTIIQSDTGIVRGKVVELVVFPSEKALKLDEVSI